MERNQCNKKEIAFSISLKITLSDPELELDFRRRLVYLAFYLVCLMLVPKIRLIQLQKFNHSAFTFDMF